MSKDNCELRGYTIRVQRKQSRSFNVSRWPVPDGPSSNPYFTPRQGSFTPSGPSRYGHDVGPYGRSPRAQVKDSPVPNYRPDTMRTPVRQGQFLHGQSQGQSPGNFYPGTVGSPGHPPSTTRSKSTAFQTPRRMQAVPERTSSLRRPLRNVNTAWEDAEAIPRKQGAGTHMGLPPQARLEEMNNGESTSTATNTSAENPEKTGSESQPALERTMDQKRPDKTGPPLETGSTSAAVAGQCFTTPVAHNGSDKNKEDGPQFVQSDNQNAHQMYNVPYGFMPPNLSPYGPPIPYGMPGMPNPFGPQVHPALVQSLMQYASGIGCPDPYLNSLYLGMPPGMPTPLPVPPVPEVPPTPSHSGGSISRQRRTSRSAGKEGGNDLKGSPK